MKGITCSQCAILTKGWCDKKVDSPHPDIERDCEYFREKTEADYIKSLDNEELAEYLFRVMHTFSKALNAQQILERLQGPAGDENRIWR